MKPAGTASCVAPWGLALALTGALAWPVAAQNPPGRPPGTPLRVTIQDMVPPLQSARPVPPLSAEQAERLRRAQSFVASQLLDRAREELVPLNREVPHHPLILAELSRIMVLKADWPGVERMVRAERSATRDSVLLGRDLALALERLDRGRDAAQVVMEVWMVEPIERDWASSSLERLVLADARGVRDVVKRACLARPERSDFALEWARIEILAGDVRPALKTLAQAEQVEGRSRLRWMFSEQLLSQRNVRDTTAATEVLLDFTADPRVDPVFRAAAGKRVYDIAAARGTTRDLAPRIQKALADLPPERWGPDLRLGLARGLRESGRTADARTLLGDPATNPAAGFALERALTDLREGPPARALPALRAAAAADPGAAFLYAEALFFAGEIDSAHTWYLSAASNPRGPDAGAALERLYLLEETSGKSALPGFGRMEYEQWRGDRVKARAIAETLWTSLPRGPLWAHAAIATAELRAAAGDARGALAPLLALADSLPGDRLAPLGRQRAGDLYVSPLKDEPAALEQYEECLARYPRAWNAAEVRRRLDALRRDRRL